MNISKIKLSNIDLIYNICDDVIRSKEFSNMSCGNKVSKLYSMSKIEVNIEDINYYEYIILKVFSQGNISKFKETDCFSRKYISNLYPELFEDGKIGDALNDIESFKDKGNDIFSVLPFGFSKIGLCSVSFSGSNLIHFLGTDPVIKFRKYIVSEEDGINHLKEYHEIKDDIIQEMRSAFNNTFYSFMERYICEKDIISEYGLYTKIIKPEYLQLNNPVLIDVSSINLYASSLTSPQFFNSDIESYKLSSLYDIDKILDVKVTFRLKVKMNHFLKLMDILKPSNIKYHTNLLMAYQQGIDNSKISDITDDYDMMTATSYIVNNINNKCNDLRKYMNTAPYSKISMILSFSLRETFSLVNTKEKIKDDTELVTILSKLINNLSVIHDALI